MIHVDLESNCLIKLHVARNYESRLDLGLGDAGAHLLEFLHVDVYM